MNSFKLQKKEDRISDLPDHIIHHILSFLPSTKQAIQTGILSKRWRNQWTRVPVLIFESPQFGMYSKQSDKQFLRLIDNALRLFDCSKIKKLQLCYNFGEDPDFVSKLRFATRKHVEELILDHRYGCAYYCYLLPEFLLDNSSLVELKMCNCCFRFDSIINWPSLKSLKIVQWSSPYFRLPSFRKLVSGCPSLESFKLRNSSGIEMNGDDDIIASKSLKGLVLLDTIIGHHLKISCPNLTELIISPTPDWTYHLPNKKIIEISCPKLVSVELYNPNDQIYKLVNCPSLVYANLDFEIHTSGENVAMQNLEQLQHVKELTINSWFIKILSALEMEGLSYPMLKNKKLTLRVTNFEDFLGISSALGSSPALEQLVIMLPVYAGQMNAYHLDLYRHLNDCGENYKNSNETDFNCLVLHLKHVQIVGLNKQDSKSKLVIDFVEFLLKNARALEKLVIVIAIGQGTAFASKISQKVLSFQRCSKNALVKIEI